MKNTLFPIPINYEFLDYEGGISIRVRGKTLFLFYNISQTLQNRPLFRDHFLVRCEPLPAMSFYHIWKQKEIAGDQIRRTVG